jgi:hypothetical protein
MNGIRKILLDYIQENIEEFDDADRYDILDTLVDDLEALIERLGNDDRDDYPDEEDED